MNSADTIKLKSAVKHVLGLMVKEKLGQLRVAHRDLHKLASLTNTRSRSLIAHVDDILTQDEIIRGGYGVYLVADVGLVDGEAQMAFIKQNTGIHHLVIHDGGTLSHKP